MDITPSSAGLVRPSPAPVPAPKAQAAPAVEIPQPQPQDNVVVTQDAAAVKALISFAQTYAVSDQKFALYKDASGQMITRYVSLRDGTITYMPAPSYTKPHAPALAINV